MITKNFIFKHFLLFLMIVSLFSAPYQSAFAGEKEVHIITLAGDPGKISPDSLNTKLGDPVVWVNKDHEAAKIIFTTKLGIACAVPVNFYADLFGYYESAKIPQGGTASICFIKKGTYDYEVRRLVKQAEAEPIEEVNKGRIIVK